MAYLPELHRCTFCGNDLGAENGDGICGPCDEAWEQIGNHVTERIAQLEGACRKALEHGEEMKYTWQDVRLTLRAALRMDEV